MKTDHSSNSAQPPVRVRHQALSLWQSVVVQFVRENNVNGGQLLPLAHPAIQSHPMVVAVSQQAEEDAEHAFRLELAPLGEPADLNDSAALHLFLSRICYRIAVAQIRDNQEALASSTEMYRKYSDHDPGFLTCATTYADYDKKYGGVMKYNAWTDKNNINYGVMDWRIPNDGKVAIIGDWGTGMPDAKNLLLTLMETHKPSVIIHLGDIYYSGTPDECEGNFSEVFDWVFSKYGARVPIFTIPGNHDYYAFGYGYYDMVSNLNNTFSGAKQDSSYFCLRTQDNGWQFLGMDTGLDDSSPSNQFNTFYAGPDLQPSEVTWHKDKLNNFKGATILLSHHQVFSANAKINGSESDLSGYPNVNKYLLDYFRPYFGDKVAAWLWGHEHNQVIYEDGLFGIPIGRLIGASAFEEMTSTDPYKVNYPNAPIQSKYQLGSDQGYFNHGYAIIDLSGRTHPTNPVEISYYEYPSWGEKAPNPIPTQPKFMMKEKIKASEPERGQEVIYGKHIYLNLEKGVEYVGKLDSGIEYYPTLRQTPVKLEFEGGDGPVRDGDIVKIKTLESAAGSYKYLGAWSTPALYYYKSGYKQEYWVIKKMVPNSSDNKIREGDPVRFVNQYYSGQYLCPLVELTSSKTYLTTDEAVPATWFCEVVDGAS